MKYRLPAGTLTETAGVIAALAASLLPVGGLPLPAVVVAGLCWIWRPRVGGWLGVVLLGLALTPGLALLPASWFPAIEWRDALLGRGTAGPLTPQPWALFSIWVLFFSGLVFLWWTSGRFSGEKIIFRQVAVLGAAVLVCGVLIFAKWESGAWRGPLAGACSAVFLTRNQAASFAAMALIGCVVYAAGVRHVRERLVCLGGAAVSGTALMMLGSRGGVLAVAAGCAVGVGILIAARWKSSRLAMTVTACIAVVGLVCFLVPAGPLVGRLASDGASGLGYRLAIQSDAVHMLASHPLSGVGLGSFEAVFPFFRDQSAAEWRTYHPESDWLWLSCEAGLLAGQLALVGGIVLVRRWWRFALVEDPLPAAAGLGVLAALGVHGLLDVPAHAAPVWYLAAALAGIGGSEVRSAVWHKFVGVGVALVLLLAAGGESALMPHRRPPGFSPDRPISQLPNRKDVEAWLRFRPMDVEVVEMALHHAIREKENALQDHLLTRMLLLEKFSEEPAIRAMGGFVATGNERLAVRCAGAILHRTAPPQRGQKLLQLVGDHSGRPELVRDMLAIPASTADWQAVRIECLQGRVGREDFLRLLELAAAKDDPGLEEHRAKRELAYGLELGFPDIIDQAGRMSSLRRAADRARVDFISVHEGSQAASMAVIRWMSPQLDRIASDAASGTDAFGLTIKALGEWRAERFDRAGALLALAANHPGPPPLTWYLLGCYELKTGSDDKAWNHFRKFLEAGDSLESTKERRHQPSGRD